MSELIIIGISSERHSHRFSHFSSSLNQLGVKYSLIDAVYFNQSQHIPLPGFFDIQGFIRRNNRNISIAELGCLVSHRVAVHRFIESSADYALILEDDVIVTSSALQKVHDLITLIGNKKFVFDILNLHVSYAEVDKSQKLEIGRFGLFRCLLECTSAAAYLMSRRGALNYLSCKARSVADFPFDLYKLKFYCLEQSILRPDDPVSTIEHQRKQNWEITEDGFVYASPCEVLNNYSFTERLLTRLFFLKRRIIRFLFIRHLLGFSHNGLR